MIIAQRIAAAEAGFDRRKPVEGEFIADKYGKMKFRRLDIMGKYIDVSDDENNEEADYYAAGPIETSFLIA